MVTITTNRGKQVNLLTPSEWYERMYGQYGRGNGLVAFEQAMYQSAKYKVCVECLSPDNLVLLTGRHWVKSTDYYMCQDCLDYYNNK